MTITIPTPNRPERAYAIRFQPGEESAAIDALVSDVNAGALTWREASFLAHEIKRTLALRSGEVAHA